jgi:hypothetical protein
MNQARHEDGSYDHGWYQDGERLAPSLGVWPLGRTYVHSSDGPLSTGPARDGTADVPASGRPPLYQVGGRYRGDDWPTDPGFRRRDQRRIERIPSLYPRLLFVVVGYAAVTSLAAAYAEKIPLTITASLIVVPAAGLIFNLGMRYPAWGRRALVGWLSGIVATIIYDLLRLALVKVGIWDDPIPIVGRLAFADPRANFAWGYLWRFMGNGGGMGIACAMLPWRGARAGIAYGTLVCSGLFAVLLFFPVAQAHLFPLTR